MGGAAQMLLGEVGAQLLEAQQYEVLGERAGRVPGEGGRPVVHHEQHRAGAAHTVSRTRRIVLTAAA